jgi:peptidase M50B-like protein
VPARTLPLLAQPAAPPVTAHPVELVVGTGLLALVITITMWPVVTHSMTVAHEGGHALFVSLFGGNVKAVRIDRNRSGRTEFAGIGWFGRFFNALAGYLGPSLFGLLGAWLLVKGQAEAVLWLGLLFLILLMLNLAKPFGYLVVLLTGALVVLVLYEASAVIQTAFAYTWVWLLLMGGFRDVVEFRRGRLDAKRTGQRDRSSDAYALFRLSLLPPVLWVGFFWLATLGALLLGAAIMLGLVPPRV